MRKTLVTGCAGFIGSNLCRRLINEGCYVIGVDNLSVGYLDNIEDFIDHENFIFIEDDVLNLNLIEDIFFHTYRDITIDSIVHLAARGELNWCDKYPDLCVANNVIGTLNILNLAKQLECKQFVFADTSAEYDSIPLDEKDCWPTEEYYSPQIFSPKGIYSISKMCAAEYVRVLCERNNIDAICLRYFNVYGPALNIYRDIPPLIGSLAYKMLNNENPIIYGDGSKRRDFIYIDDVIDLHIEILRNIDRKINSTFNVGTGVNFSVYEIYELVSQYIFGDENKWLDIEYKEDNNREAQVTLASISHVKRYYDWAPKIEIEEGINYTIESIKERINRRS